MVKSSKKKRLEGIMHDAGAFLATGVVAGVMNFLPVRNASAKPASDYSTSQHDNNQTENNYDISGNVYIPGIVDNDVNGLEALVRLIDSEGNVVDSVYSDMKGDFTFKDTNVFVDDIDVDRYSPKNFKVLQNFPNPFNASTNIPVYLKKGGDVEVDIFNIMGQKVADYRGRLPAGENVLNFSAGDGISAGNYIANVRSGNERNTIKMTLVDGGSGSTEIRAGFGNFNVNNYNDSNNNKKVKKGMSGEYRIEVVADDFYRFLSNPFNYNGGKVDITVPMIESNLSYNPNHFDSFLDMFRELTGSNWSGGAKNTLLGQAYAPIELYGVHDNIPQSPRDWSEMWEDAVGDYNTPDSTSLEGTTGINLIKIMDGERGSAEDGKTKIRIVYATRDEMPTGHSGSDAVIRNEAWDGLISTMATIYFNRNRTEPRDNYTFITSLIQKELMRGLMLFNSFDQSHIMNTAGDNKTISLDESRILTRMYNMERRFDMSQYPVD